MRRTTSSLLAKSLLCFALSAAASLIVHAALMAQSSSQSPDASPRSPRSPLNVVRSSAAEFVVEFTPQFQGWDTIRAEGKQFILPRIAGTHVAGADAGTHVANTRAAKQASGSPACLEFRVPIAVPAPEGFRLASSSVSGVRQQSGVMAPVPSLRQSFVTVTRATIAGQAETTEPTQFTESVAQTAYLADERAYAQARSQARSQTGAPEWCRMEYAGIGRDRHIAYIIFRAARYDAASGMVQIPTTMRASIQFTVNQLTANQLITNDATSSADAAYAMPSPALNYEQSRAWEPVESIANAISNTGVERFAADATSNAPSNTASNNMDTVDTVDTTTLLSTKNPSGTTQSTAPTLKGRWYRLAVGKEGIYRLTADQLRANGITVTPQEVSSLRLYGYGGAPLPELVSLGQANTLPEQPLIVDTAANGQINSIAFYGAAASGWRNNGGRIEHYINHFTYTSDTSQTNYYLLNVGGDAGGKRATFTATNDLVSTIRPNRHTGRFFWEKDEISPFKHGMKMSTPWTLPLSLNNLVPTGNVNVRYALATVAEDPGQMPYTIRRETSSGRPDTLVSSIIPGVFSSQTYSVAYILSDTVSFPAAGGTNGSTTALRFSATPLSARDEPTVDWVEVAYPRAFMADGNQLDFFTEPPANNTSPAHIGEYTITNFNTSSGAGSGAGSGTSAEVFVVDATEPSAPVFYRNHATVGGQAYFKASFTTPRPLRFFVSSQVMSNVGITAVDASSIANLRSDTTGADMLVITSRALLASAERYRNYRATQSGLRVKVATTEQIYTEFAAGMPDHTAIRDYIAYTYKNARIKPRFVLFWGDGHKDYRGILFKSNTYPNYVPAYQSYDNDNELVSAVWTNLVTEDFYACVAGNDNVVDVALGRLPVRENNSGGSAGASAGTNIGGSMSNDNGDLLLSKIQRYEQGAGTDAWRTQMTLVADDSQTSYGSDGNIHVAQAETLAQQDIPTDMRVRRIYMPEYPAERDITSRTGGIKRPAVTQDLLSAINAGTAMLNWTGHGAPSLWAHEQIFTNDLIPQLRNLDRLFFLTAATCDYARFDSPDVRCGAELLVESPVGGAIGIFTATRVVDAFRNAVINEEFHKTLFTRQPDGRLRTMGEVLYTVKQTLYDINDVKYCLLGDPSLRLNIPQQQVMFTNIAGSTLTTLPVERPRVQALQRFEVSGVINALGAPGTPTATGSITGGSVDNAFNGNVSLLLYDTDVNRQPIDVDGTTYNYNRLGGLLNFATTPVRGGRFTTSLVLPKDISFSELPGRLFGYAFSDDTRKFARGITSQFRLGGIQEDVVNDGAGPTVTLSLDSRRFRAGDFVPSSPLLIVDLFDQTGLNASGVGIGHDIQCWVDNALLPLNLTPNFVPSIEDSRRGSVQTQLLNLSVGIHRVRVRAWDVFNNFSETETWFRVEGTKSPFVTEALAYPNPFGETATLQFRHNIPALSSAQISIYDSKGTLVRTLASSIESRTGEVPWDGRNDSGVPVAAGVYVFRVVLTNAEGQSSAATGKLVRSR
jgi:hypothetical protein